MKPQKTIFLSPAWLEPHSLKFLNRPKYSKANFAVFCFDGIIFCGIYIILWLKNKALKSQKILNQTLPNFCAKWQSTTHNIWDSAGILYWFWTCCKPFNSHDLIANSPLAVAHFLGNNLWEFDVRSRLKLVPDEFEYSHYLFAGRCMDIKGEVTF